MVETKMKKDCAGIAAKSKKRKYTGYFSDVKANWQLYVMILLPLAYVLLFKYVPMFGARIAFYNYYPVKGVSGSEWVGMAHFIKAFQSPQFWTLIKNTMAISLLSLFVSFPFAVCLAIGLNYVKSRCFKKTVQMVTYLPHFISTVIVVSMLTLLFNTQSGVINNMIYAISGEKINFLGLSKYFRPMYVLSGVWVNAGWNSILYVSALSGVDPNLHEAAVIDGANKIRRIWHIDLPSIMPTLATMLIMNMGSILTVGFDKTYLMQNATNLEVSEVLSTYEYKIGIGGGMPQYSYSTAIGLIASLTTFILVTITNKISNKLADTGLW